MEYAGPRVGLALGGGLARGMAHVGVLAVLTRAGIPIHAVAGTSAGALVGAFYCAGMTTAEIEYIASHIRWRDIVRPAWSRYGLVSFAKIEEMVVRLLGDVTFDDLERPLAVVTCDVETGEEVVLTEGRVAAAVRATSSVPGIVTPRRIGGRLLGDGAIVNNLPASVARSLGVEYVIGVDIFEPAFNRRWGPLGLLLTSLELLVSRAGAGEQGSDCLIRPALAGISYLLFANRGTLNRRGREAAEAALPQLKADLGLD